MLYRSEQSVNFLKHDIFFSILEKGSRKNVMGFVLVRQTFIYIYLYFSVSCVIPDDSIVINDNQFLCVFFFYITPTYFCFSVTIMLMLQSNVKMKIKSIKLFDRLYVVFKRNNICKKKNCKNFCGYFFLQVLHMDI